MVWIQKRLIATVVFVTLLVNVVVASTVMVVYPARLWAFELSVSLTLSTGLAILLTAVLTRQAHHTARLAEELRHMVNRDRLTDVATRDGFFGAMEAAPRRSGVVLMIDIDHFKSVNDTHGHLVGDAVIRKVAQVLRENCRPQDIVCRFGGEEFVLFLDGAEPDSGAFMAERLRRKVAQAATCHGDDLLHVTVSVGGAVKGAARDLEAAIHDADTALYRAKQTGRNRTIMSWSDPPNDGPNDGSASGPNDRPPPHLWMASA
ncbi:GGDEF domain-containing protein [Pseudooctadecabacter sp.]|uniref:GGDEF domain-containing protein n=1 Tax=Pseudooctadecabacter sp. TaxID=1966338 RepID=UPI0035C7DB07